MRIISEYGKDNLATVFVASIREGKSPVEFVESLQPPLPREEKWVLIVSCMFGCPVGCVMCDAGGGYGGKLTAEEIIAQARHMVLRRYPSGIVPAAKFKVQFARMGEPAMNDAVLDAVEALPREFNAPGLMPALSTIAPNGCDDFFMRLVEMKDRLYGGGKFQMQFSIHSTDAGWRKRLIPVKKWGLGKIAEYGEAFWKRGDRKISLNFAASQGVPIDCSTVGRIFDPSKFVIKLTPLNPTVRALQGGLVSVIDPANPPTSEELVTRFRKEGFDVVLSIGETEENMIGSNCGQFVTFAQTEKKVPGGSYMIEKYAHADPTVIN